MLAVIDSDNNLLARAAWHEGGHAIAALYYDLPLREVLIRENGTGLTSYCRRLVPAVGHLRLRWRRGGV
jgi:hypothetical protein